MMENIKKETANANTEEIKGIVYESSPELDQFDDRNDKYLKNVINMRRHNIETVNQVLHLLDLGLVEIIYAIEQGINNSDKFNDVTGLDENCLVNAHEINNYLYALKTFKELKRYLIKNYGIFNRFCVDSD